MLLIEKVRLAVLLLYMKLVRQAFYQPPMLLELVQVVHLLGQRVLLLHVYKLQALLGVSKVVPLHLLLCTLKSGGYRITGFGP